MLDSEFPPTRAQQVRPASTSTSASAADRINQSRRKRLLDYCGAGVGLALLLPFVLLPIAIAIKLDSRGPVLYRQLRNGQHGPFQIWKFRSMVAEPEGAAFRQAVAADPRVTRVGRFLRRFNLDELPQLLNVLTGDMSLVGPRPHPLPLDQAYATAIPNLHQRYLVRPGLTGWAQVNGLRGETKGLEPMAQRVRHDLDYIQNWSLWLDLQIIWRTVWFKQAYANAH